MFTFRNRPLCLLLAIPLGLLAQTPSYTISTVAGNVPPDGTPGPSVPLNAPSGIAADRNGNVYVVERGGARVRKLSPDGKVSGFAGNGVSGFRSQGSAPATEEPLYQPRSMAFGPDGTAYITDNQTILQVSPAGELSTYAQLSSLTQGDCATGDKHLRFAERVALGPDGALYIVSFVDNRVCKLLPDKSLVLVAGTGEQGDGGDGVRPRQPCSTSPRAWRWTAPATSTSPMRATVASAR